MTLPPEQTDVPDVEAPTMDSASADLVNQVNAHLDSLDRLFVARRGLLELLLLGLITKEHVLLIGPPGTGKSAAVQELAKSLSASSFEYLIGRFTEPSELFGALDLNALKDGRLQPVTAGMLPEANVAFLDEIFLGSTAILNTLLKLLNERTYRRGQFKMDCPLVSCVAASNSLPEDPQLNAFADRFLLTMFVKPVDDHEMTPLLQKGWEQFKELESGVSPLNKSTLDALHKMAMHVDVEAVTEAYAHIVRKLRLIGLPISDRKAIKGLKTVAAAAVLRGQSVAGPEDLWPVTYLVQDQDQQTEAREILSAELKDSFNPVMTESVVASTYGKTAHAATLTTRSTRLLEEKPDTKTDPLYEVWLVKLETMLTRIDAAFGADDLPEPLKAVRASIVALLELPAGKDVAINTSTSDDEMRDPDNT